MPASIGQVAEPPSDPRAAALRVAFCIDNMNVGGTEMNALRTARHLIERGVELSVFSLSGDGPLIERYAELGVPVRFLPIGSLFGRGTVRYGREMSSIVRRERIDVVHAHDVYSNIFAAPWARVGGAAFIASRRWWAGSERRTQRWANRCSYVLADRVLANSPSVAGLLIGAERVRSASVVVVPNFLDEAAFDPPPPGWVEAFATEIGLPADRQVVGVVASLSPVKDHGTLLRALAALAPRWPQLHVVLVGADAGSRDALEQMALRLGVGGHVHFTGLRPNLPSPHYLFDISALTSLSEGMPNSVLEAMAAGRPVVATSVGAIPDAVVEGATGFLVRPGDADALADRFDELLANESLRASMGACGREWARAQYSVDRALVALLDTYAAVRRAAQVGDGWAT